MKPDLPRPASRCSKVAILSPCAFNRSCALKSQSGFTGCNPYQQQFLMLIILLHIASQPCRCDPCLPDRFWLARQLLPPPEAMIATMLMAGSLVLAAEAHLAKTDAMLAAVTLGQQALLWRIFVTSRSGDHVSGRLAIGFWACFAFGILIKGQSHRSSPS